MNPTRKVAAGGLGGALTIVVVAVLQQVHFAVDATLASALTVIVTFLISYFIPEADTSVPVNGQKGTP